MTQGGSHADRPVDREHDHWWVCGHGGGPFTGTLHQVKSTGRTDLRVIMYSGALAMILAGHRIMGQVEAEASRAAQEGT